MYDDREIVVNGGTRQLVSEIEIPVYVAEKFSDTCGEAAADGIEWPRTKKVIVRGGVRGVQNSAMNLQKTVKTCQFHGKIGPGLSAPLTLKVPH